MSSVDGAQSLMFASDEAFVSICGPCHYNGTEKEATHFCEDCKEHLCQNCTDAHKGLRISRNHKVSPLKNVLAQTTLTQSCNVFCGCTMNLEVTVYCEDHLDVICASCKTLTHGKCKTVLISQKCVQYTPAKLNAIAQKAAALKNKTDSFLKDRHADLKKLASMKEKCKNDIQTFVKELTALINMLEQNTLKKLESFEMKQRQDIERHLSTFKTTKQMVDADEKTLNEAMKSSEKNSMFAADVKISKRLKDYERLLKDTRYEIKSPMITFHRHEELAALQTKTTDLGSLTGTVTETVLSKGILFTDMNIVSSSQVDIKLPDDKKIPYISGCAFFPSGQTILCDYFNNNLKLLSSTFSVTEILQLQSEPWDVSLLSNSNAVVTLPSKKQIHFLQTVPKLKTERIIQLDKQCWGVEVAGEEIYVLCVENFDDGEVRVLDMAGNVTRRLGVNQDGKSIFVDPNFVTLSADAGTVYVSDAKTNTITRLKTDGRDIYTYQNINLKFPRGICVDGEGNMVICSQNSNEVRIVSSDGRKNTTLLSSKEGVRSPHCVAYSNGTLIVGCWKNIKLFVFKVK